MTSIRLAKKLEKKKPPALITKAAETIRMIVDPTIPMEYLEEIGIDEDLRGKQGDVPLINPFANKIWSKFILEKDLLGIKKISNELSIPTSWLKPVPALENN